MFNDNLLTSIITKLQLDPERVEKIETLIDSMQDLIENDFSSKDYSHLISTRDYMSGFKNRLLFEYSKPIQEMEIFIEHCKGIGESTSKRLDSENSKKGDALLRLYQKSTLIASEIVYLVKGGYASAATSRWRSLFEVSVITMFLALNDEETSVRYFDYEVVERKRELDTYLSNMDYLGFEKIPDKTIANINKEYNDVLEKYGKAFARSFGWASFILKKEKLSLHDLMDNTNTHYLKPFYQFSNNYVHGGPKSLFDNLGYIDGISSKNTISGASNIGFTDAGQLTALSYYNVTLAYFSYNPIMEDLISLLHLYSKINRIGTRFFDVEQEIIKREIRINELD
ncbi:DUF5677 domain-containing protein [Leptospira stimsonii]|uniref:Uncharacterized protein n=1 Tax=Leptospira stimsonii TaxID=2202203 RepID=A0ABY2N521_9LEPT|nr:DUF5677 domain-containing protein [Leptospira stimsonii]TGK23594.1 hypothetical protein EHO98_04910 [Leptospira stimsonii]TGM17232.1 hypothetical protein EHQ90_07830 [Leptospira stimsonii]